MENHALLFCLHGNGHFLCSFTYITVTKDCIEAEEYWEDSSSSAMEDDDSNVARKLFSEDNEEVSLL